MRLPEAFTQQMRALLGEDWPSFLAAWEGPPFRGLRRNALKCPPEVFSACFGETTVPAPFATDCYYDNGPGGIGASPLHHAGAVYAQEPSAACAVTVLDPQPGERVLDLCAAPGGKATQIAARLGGEGLLWANEPVRSRAQVLLSNLERLGVCNAVVSVAYPEQLCPALPGWFDRVLVDAPCSGEGMFRREPRALAEWNAQTPTACARRQLGILLAAADCVRPGGVLVYSTCTFSREENEGVVEQFLARRPDFAAEDPGVSFGRAAFGVPGVRVLPMDGGEGHFAARLRRLDGPETTVSAAAPPRKTAETERIRAALLDLMPNRAFDSLALQGERVLLLPAGMPAVRLPLVRAGVEAGVWRGGRLEPAHALFMSAKPQACARVLDFSPEDPRLAAFLHGEEIPCEEKGYTAVSVCGVMTGFGKAGNGVLKNKYPRGLRTLG